MSTHTNTCSIESNTSNNTERMIPKAFSRQPCETFSLFASTVCLPRVFFFHSFSLLCRCLFHSNFLCSFCVAQLYATAPINSMCRLNKQVYVCIIYVIHVIVVCVSISSRYIILHIHIDSVKAEYRLLSAGCCCCCSWSPYSLEKKFPARMQLKLHIFVISCRRWNDGKSFHFLCVFCFWTNKFESSKTAGKTNWENLYSIAG